MANIRNSITLQDRMTPVFRSIIRSMDSTLRVMKRLDQQANKGVQSKAYRAAERDIKQANNALIKMTNQLNKADQSAQKLSGSTGRISSSMSGLSAKGFNLTNFASALYLLKNISGALSEIMETPDTVRSMAYRLDTYDDSALQGDALMTQVYNAANESRSDMVSTGQLASRILITGATDNDAMRSIDLAETMNKASFLGGSSAGESQRSLLQLSQSLASGFLQGDELRAMREQAPGLMDTLAKGLDRLAESGALSSKFLDVTMGDLKQLGADGELTADRVIAAFEAMKGEVDETFENSPKLFSQAMARASNVWTMFVELLSQGDGAFAKINEAAWQFADWMASEEGWDVLSDLATILGVIADALIWVGQKAGEGFIWLHDNAIYAQTALLTLATAFVIMGAAGAASWLAVAWPALLVLTILAIIIYTFLKLGYTVSEVMGGIVGVLYVLGAIIYDTILLFIDLIWSVITVVWDVTLAVLMGIGTLISGVIAVFEGLIMIIVGLFQGLGNAVLGILWLIASAIDAIFGSDLASSVSGWMSGLNDWAVGVYTDLDPSKLPLFQADTWANAPWLDIGQMTDWMEGAGFELWDPGAAYESGAAIGGGFGSQLESFDLFDQIARLNDQLAGYARDGTTTVDGGNLDSVGSIGSDVNISDEDLQLLRDIAAKEFLIQMASLTPQVNVSFGDIRETADVNAIMGVIETMAEEALATSLVGA